MKFRLILLFVFCVFGTVRSEILTADQEELLTTDIELDEFDFEEMCAQIIPFEWSRTVHRNYNVNEALSAAETYANAQREKSKKFSVRLRDDSPTRDAETTRKLEIISQPGDILLPPHKYKRLLVFSNEVQDAIVKKRKDCNSSAMSCDLTSRDPTQLLNTLSKQSIVGTDEISKEYPSILNLVSDAATENGFPDAESYWLMLSDLDSDSYRRAQNLWEDVKPFYQKFHHWVAMRLQNKYGKKAFQETNNSIPLHLMGSYLGNDWTSIADIVLSNECANTYHDIEKALEEKQLKGKKLYEKAETLTGYLHLGKMSKRFWEDSEFDQSCPARSIDPCHSEVRVAACNKVSWHNYLDAHRIMMQSAYTQINDFSSLSFILKNGNRYSAIYDSVSGLAETLASSRHYMAQYGLVTPSDGCALQTVLTLIALRVLPLLPYYLVADLARLQAKKTNNTDNIGAIWKELQLNLQGISTPDKEWWGFLMDPHVTWNEPYINKFYGIFVQFHLFEELMTNNDESFAEAEEFIHKKEEFKLLLASGKSKKWPILLEEIFKIKNITSAPLLRFFSRFEATLSSVPSKISTTNSKSKTIGVSTAATATGENVTIVLVADKDKNDLKVSSQEEDKESFTNNVLEGLGIGSYLLISFLVLASVLILVVIAKFVYKKTRKTYQPPAHQNEQA